MANTNKQIPALIWWRKFDLNTQEYLSVKYFNTKIIDYTEDSGINSVILIYATEMQHMTEVRQIRTITINESSLKSFSKA